MTKGASDKAEYLDPRVVKIAQRAVLSPVYTRADDNIARAVSSAIYRQEHSEIARCLLRLIADLPDTQPENNQ